MWPSLRGSPGPRGIARWPDGPPPFRRPCSTRGEARRETSDRRPPADPGRACQGSRLSAPSGKENSKSRKRRSGTSPMVWREPRVARTCRRRTGSERSPSNSMSTSASYQPCSCIHFTASAGASSRNPPVSRSRWSMFSASRIAAWPRSPMPFTSSSSRGPGSIVKVRWVPSLSSRSGARTRADV